MLRRWLIPIGTAAAVGAIIGVLVLVRSLPSMAHHRTGPSKNLDRPGRPLYHARQIPRTLSLRLWAGRRSPGWTAWAEVGRGSQDLTVSAVAASSPASAWAFAYDNSGSNLRPVAWKLSGSAWTQVSFPGRPGEQVLAAGASSPASAWAFTSDGRALHWNGSSWRVAAGAPARSVSEALVISSSDVWIFGQLYPENDGAPGTWHYNGRAWTRVPSASGLDGASAVSADDIWAAGQTVISHWNGASWSTSSVAALMPRRTMYCGGVITDIYAVSATDAWALGWQGCQDTGGSAVLLHYAGGSWHRAANLGDADPVAVLPDGHGGVWIQLSPDPQQKGHVTEMRYSGGTLGRVRLPLLGQLDLLGSAVTLHGAASFAVGSYGKPYSTGFVVRYEP